VRGAGDWPLASSAPWLQWRNEPPTLRESFGLNRTELGRIEDELADDPAALCAEWSKIHGRH
jgi:hypothetical protein